MGKSLASVPAAFDAVGPFDQNGLAEIIVNGRIGRINRQGETVCGIKQAQ